MNCEMARKKITESLASAAPKMRSAVRAHCEDCPECRVFYEKERNLYSRLEGELGNFMNPAVPVSLAPGVRARLDEVPVRRLFWVPRLFFAATTLAILVVCGAYLTRGPRDQSRGAHLEAPSGQNSGLAPATPLPAKSFAPSKSRTEKRRRALPPSGLPEVIISAEERQAFARFVARIPEARDAAVALTLPPASSEADAPIEIALLDLGFVEVKPLEPETAE